MARGPVKHTCPDIDIVIDAIKDSVRSLDSLPRIMEELRESNDSLRCWGIDLEEELNSANNEIDTLNKTIEDLQQQVADLHLELINRDEKHNLSQPT